MFDSHTEKGKLMSEIEATPLPQPIARPFTAEEQDIIALLKSFRLTEDQAIAEIRKKQAKEINRTAKRIIRKDDLVEVVYEPPSQRVPESHRRIKVRNAEDVTGWTARSNLQPLSMDEKRDYSVAECPQHQDRQRNRQP